MILRSTLKALPASALFAATLFGAASAQQACSTYVVQEGDTIGNIAIKAYGTQLSDRVQRQPRKIGNDISGLKPGTELVLPCADGRLTADAAAGCGSDPASASLSTNEIDDYSPSQVRDRRRLVSLADEGLTGGGFLVRLVETAMHRAGNNRDWSVGSMTGIPMTVLLPFNAYDLSIAWYVPDCTKTDSMSEMTHDFCDNFVFSKPLYDAVFGFFTRADSPYAGAKTLPDFAGARICRSEGYSMHALDEAGLIEPAVTISIPPLIGDCAEGVMQGLYDVMSWNRNRMVPSQNSGWRRVR